jgi:hypothetical protein
VRREQPGEADPDHRLERPGGQGLDLARDEHLQGRLVVPEAGRGLTIEFSQYGHLVARTKTGADGSYRINLSSKGRYVIGVKGGPGVAPTVKPPTATIEQGQFKHLDIQLDVGIR